MYLESNCTNPGSAIPLIITHLDVNLKILILQATKELFVSRHVERCTTIQVPH